AGEAGSGTQLWADDLGVGARRGLGRRNRRRARLIGKRLAFHEHLDFVGVEHFADEKSLGDVFESAAVGLDDAAGLVVGLIDDALHFHVDVQGGVFAEVAMLGNFAAEEDSFFLLAVSQRTHVAHAPFADHVARDIGGAFDVVSGAGGDVAEENFLGGAAAHENGEHAFQVFLGVGVLVGFGELHGEAESHAARNDGDLVDGIGSGSHGGDQSVAGFVIGGVLLFLVGEDHGAALDAHHDLVLGHF